MKKVLFLCTGNSCRSQMAEAIVNARLGETWEAVSAGTKPAGYVHPKALIALSEIGIQHEGRSKLADERFSGHRLRFSRGGMSRLAWKREAHPS